MLKVKAKFKGQDGSLGYKHGEVYNLHMAIALNKLIITLPTGSNLCPYGSMKAFLQNWDVL
jgi:hypothetical protein